MRLHPRVPHLLGLVALLLGALALPLATTAQTPTCADYSSTAAAQFALDINPGLASSLDPDGNGIACDDASGTAPTPSSAELQLPTGAAETPSTAASQPQPTVDVIDGQPSGATTATTQPQTQPQASGLDGRIGGTRASFEAAHGQPVQETPSQNNPSVTGVAYAGTGSISDLFVVYASDQAIIVWLTPAQPWTTDEASGILSGFVPADVTTLPQPEPLSDGSLLMTVNSPTLAGGVTQEALTAASIPGAPGDMYLLLTTDGGQLITEVEIGVGNGDNVRAAVNGDQATGDVTPAPGTVAQQTTPTPATTTTTGTATDSATFLQQARTEVDRYQAEITELRTILGKDTFTEADTSRVTEIAVGWMAIDTTPMSAPPEHAAIGQQLTSIHADLSTVGGIVFGVLSTGDTSQIQEAADTLNRADQNLTTLDQQLTALGV
jgi:hypothetical protein